MGMAFPKDTENLELKKNRKKWNLNSLWAFLISILVYVWVFYVFNLSPSIDLFCTTKFWFIISNTLILIIAADFSSSPSTIKHHQSYYNIINLTTTITPSLIHHKTMQQHPKEEEEEVDHHQQPPEKIINIVENKPAQISKIHHEDEDDGDAEINKSKLAGAENEGTMVLLEENEFTKMSDEELNKRVEEFIRRCNRQIRLQALSSNRGPQG